MNREPDASFTVRPATLQDLDGAVDMFIEVASEGRWIGTELPVDRDERLRKWAASLDDPKNAMFVAVESIPRPPAHPETSVAPDGRVIGHAGLKWAGASDLGMAVARDRRGRGVGRALLEACIRWAEEHRVHKIELKVWPHNEAAIALYESFGFEREGYLKKHYRRRNGELWDCLLMGLQLPRSTTRPPKNERWGLS
ncbi:MAG: GNAT family N-acetyltransferase [Actinomycetota bacterium]|nr:GNAT family N-acetyltransferase [Actinomycetota bacterium]